MIISILKRIRRNLRALPIMVRAAKWQDGPEGQAFAKLPRVLSREKFDCGSCVLAELTGKHYEIADQELARIPGRPATIQAFIAAVQRSGFSIWEASSDAPTNLGDSTAVMVVRRPAYLSSGVSHLVRVSRGIVYDPDMRDPWPLDLYLQYVDTPSTRMFLTNSERRSP